MVSLPHFPHPSTTIALTALVILYLLVITLAIGLDHQPWGDERHHVQTIEEFAHKGVFEASLDYREMAPPLTFALYSHWGAVAGMELASLRVLSLIVAGVTFFLFGSLLLRNTAEPWYLVAGMVTFALNPYTVGLSLFVFTDMLMILCLLILIEGVRREKIWIVVMSIMAGLLVRQYFVFAVAGSAAFYMLRSTRGHQAKDRIALVSVLAAILPLGAIMVRWGGVAPPSGLEYWVIERGITFHPEALVLYVALLSFFLFPVLILRHREFVFARREHAIVLGMSLLYLAYPISPSAETVQQTGRASVGLLHRGLNAAMGDEMFVHIVLFMGFTAGLHVLWWVVRSAWRSYQARECELRMFLDLLIIAFLGVMPWSYQVWEKYFLALVPVVILRLSLRARSRTT